MQICFKMYAYCIYHGHHGPSRLTVLLTWFSIQPCHTCSVGLAINETAMYFLKGKVKKKKSKNTQGGYSSKVIIILMQHKMIWLKSIGWNL